MKNLVVIHGSPRRGNTERMARFFLGALQKRGQISVREYRMPQDLPEFCRGCCACVTRGEEHCPHARYSQPILRAMLQADGLIFTTPVYMMSASGGMKNFLDHFPFLFLIHRPRPELFGKPAVILCTTAGAGTRPAMETVARCIRFWGVGRIFRLGFAMRAGSWEEVPGKRRADAERRADRLAARFWRALCSGRKRASPFSRAFFLICRQMHRSGKDVPLDRAYWKSHGWLESGSLLSAAGTGKFPRSS